MFVDIGAFSLFSEEGSCASNVCQKEMHDSDTYKICALFVT